MRHSNIFVAERDYFRAVADLCTFREATETIKNLLRQRGSTLQRLAELNAELAGIADRIDGPEALSQDELAHLTRERKRLPSDIGVLEGQVVELADRIGQEVAGCGADLAGIVTELRSEAGPPGSAGDSDLHRLFDQGHIAAP